MPMSAATPFSAPTSTKAARMPTAATMGIHRAVHRRLAAAHAAATQASTSALRSLQRT